MFSEQFEKWYAEQKKMYLGKYTPFMKILAHNAYLSGLAEGRKIEYNQYMRRDAKYGKDLMEKL